MTDNDRSITCAYKIHLSDKESKMFFNIIFDHKAHKVDKKGIRIENVDRKNDTKIRSGAVARYVCRQLINILLKDL